VAHTLDQTPRRAKPSSFNQVKAGFSSEPLGIAMHADWVGSNDAGYRQEMIAKPPPTLPFFRPKFREASEKEIARLLRERSWKKKDA
jgi:hypothetical protein